MFVRKNLVYFGFPKCGSSWMRWALGIRWGAAFDPHDWDACPPVFVHGKPSKFVERHDLRERLQNGTVTAFTIVRNPFARLVSCWAWATTNESAVNRLAAQDADGRTLSFEEFVRRIHAHRDDLQALPLCWMYMPFERYFEGVDVDNLMVLHLENPGGVVAFLRSKGIRVRNKVVAPTKHAHYSTYYTPELRALAEEVYAHELERFGYAFEAA